MYFLLLYRASTNTTSWRVGQSLAGFIRERLMYVDRDRAVAKLQRDKRGRSSAPERIENQRVCVARRDYNASHKLRRKRRRVLANIPTMTNLPDRRRVVAKRIAQHAKTRAVRISHNHAALLLAGLAI